MLWLPVLQLLVVSRSFCIILVGKAEAPEAELLPSIPRVLSLNKENLQHSHTYHLRSKRRHPFCTITPSNRSKWYTVDVMFMDQAWFLPGPRSHVQQLCPTGGDLFQIP